MMRIFMAICCALLTVSPLLAQGGRMETARIYRLPRFERAVRCIKFFEGWHTENIIRTLDMVISCNRARDIRQGQ